MDVSDAAKGSVMLALRWCRVQNLSYSPL